MKIKSCNKTDLFNRAEFIVEVARTIREKRIVLKEHKKVISILLIFVFFQGYSKTIDLNSAKEIGTEFLQYRISGEFQLQIKEIYKKQDTCLIYIFESIQPNCFVIVSADDQYGPVLGYSNKETFQYQIIRNYSLMLAMSQINLGACVRSNSCFRNPPLIL